MTRLRCAMAAAAVTVLFQCACGESEQRSAESVAKLIEAEAPATKVDCVREDGDEFSCNAMNHQRKRIKLVATVSTANALRAITCISVAEAIYLEGEFPPGRACHAIGPRPKPLR
jgi:hypothetical protein